MGWELNKRQLMGFSEDVKKKVKTNSITYFNVNKVNSGKLPCIYIMQLILSKHVFFSFILEYGVGNVGIIPGTNSWLKK